MRQVFILGAYGQRNLGDDALLEVFTEQFADYRVVVNSARPEETARQYGVDAVPTYLGWPRFARLRALDAFLEELVNPNAAAVTLRSKRLAKTVPLSVMRSDEARMRSVVITAHAQRSKLRSRVGDDELAQLADERFLELDRREAEDGG